MLTAAILSDDLIQLLAEAGICPAGCQYVFLAAERPQDWRISWKTRGGQKRAALIGLNSTEGRLGAEKAREMEAALMEAGALPDYCTKAQLTLYAGRPAEVTITAAPPAALLDLIRAGVAALKKQEEPNE